MLELGEWRLLNLTTGVETRKGRLMKLLYTDMSQDLTEILTEQATSYAQKGKRVFYIAPNALSFEKERKVLEYLPQSASFEITVTRFTQMARYFILNTSTEGCRGRRQGSGSFSRFCLRSDRLYC